ncbi:MAG: NTP/NDP exchange transporter [Vicinamibacteraceae bacterium]
MGPSEAAPRTVRPGEGLGAFLLATNLFVLLATYYLLKTVREVLILSAGGVEMKTFATVLQAVLLLAAMPLYGWVAARWDRARLVTAVTLFFGAQLVAFAIGAQAGLAIDVPFYVWLGIFNLVIVAQFWAFASDVYTTGQGRRLFPIIGIGSSLGALVGASLSGILLANLGAHRVILLAAVLLAVSAGTTRVISRHVPIVRGMEPPSQLPPQRGSRAGDAALARAAGPLRGPGGFQLVFSDRYLLLIAVFVMLLNVVNTGGEFLLSKLVMAEAATVAGQAADAGAATRAFIGSFYARYFTLVGIVGLVGQVFLVSRLFQRIGVAGALFVTPVIALGGYVLLAAVPLLGVLAVTKLFENAADYSIQNTARHALFLSVGRDAKYKATQAIEAFFWRAGDLLHAALVVVGTALVFGVREYALLLTAIAAAWLVVAALIGREHRRRELRIVSQPAVSPTSSIQFATPLTESRAA